MATILRSSPLLLSPPTVAAASLEARRGPSCFSIRHGLRRPSKLQLSLLPVKGSRRFPAFLPFATFEETAEAGEAVEETSEPEGSDDEVPAGDGGVIDTEETAASVVLATLQSYKQALVNDDRSTVAEIEAFLQSIEDEKNALANKVATLNQELLTERDRLLRISADFDNFRKRTERERLSLMTNVQGEVVESLLPVLDNFERAKTQIKVETEGEEKINNSYQSIYKQFMEILTSIGVEELETVGNAFDPLLHEAIMREESTEFEEGIIIQEFRKGFKLGDRLLRPSMVKVSAGPGPAKPEGNTTVTSADEEGSRETEQESVEEGRDPV